MAHGEVTNKTGSLPARKPSDRSMAVSVGCLFQVIGVSVFCAVCGLLLAALGGFRRPLRSLGIGIGTAPEIALLLISFGLLIAVLGNRPLRALLETATRSAAPDDPAGETDGREHEGGATPGAGPY